MRVAIGTMRAPKVDGVKGAFAVCPYFDGVRDFIEYVPCDAPSGVSHMPISRDEVMRGAYGRVRAMRQEGVEADLYIGIEGGTERFGEHAYLFGCVYIENAAGEGHYGFSPALEVPDAIADMLYREGKELGPIMHALTAGKDVRSANGSMGEWSDDMFTRKDEFVSATCAALAPFFNAYYQVPLETIK